MKRFVAVSGLVLVAACSSTTSQHASTSQQSASRRVVQTLPSFPKEDSYESYRWAIETDNLAGLQQLVAKGLGPNLVMPDSNPALVYAMVNGSQQVVEWLIRHPQLNVSQTNGRGDDALTTASGLGELKWVELLVKRGGQVNPASGWTPLHYAAANNRLSVIEFLLEKSANVNAKSANGTTALMMAARSNATEAVALLLKKGARADSVNEAGFSALAYARRNGNAEMEALIRRVSPN